MNTSHLDARVSELLGKMTLEEKIGQLVQFSSGIATGPDSAKIDQKELAARGLLGSVINLVGAEATNQLQREAVEKSRLKIPILFGLDIIHGYRTVYPIPLAMAATWNAGLAEDCARMAAVEGAAVGIRWTFSPMVDIARDPRWGRITEGSGEDPYLGEIMAAAWTKGYQGEDLSAPTALLACAKHFAAYGAAEGGRDYNTVDLSERELRGTYLPPFKAAIDAGVATFMSAFNTLNGVPTSADPFILDQILRREWDFKGMVVSDWNSIGELIPHGFARDGADAAARALQAGVDMDMQSNLYITRMADLVREGKVREELVDRSVVRVLRLKFALGLFENPYVDESREKGAMLAESSIALARRAAEESFVLLKNEPFGEKGPLLPLRPGQKVALIGELADSQADMFGAWVLQGKAEDVVTLRRAMEERLGEGLFYARGTGPKDLTGEDFAEALIAAEQADVVVMALGESADMSGEAFCRTSLDLPGRQQELLEAVLATDKPVILVLFNGRPLSLKWEAANVPAILEAWFPGVQAGPALLRALYGEINPSGKLTATFPRSVGQVPLYYNSFNTGRPSPGADRYVTGYLDDSHKPLYPFGWGLSYTRFEISKAEVTSKNLSVSDLDAGAKIEVSARVKNIGDREGSEVLQLYIRQRGASVVRPVRELKGYQKVFLQPGEARELKFTLGRKELQFWNADMELKVEAGELSLWVARHAEDGEAVTFLLE